MRYAAPAFGPLALIWLRVAIAALCLAVPLLVLRRQVGALREHALGIVVIGIFGSALPFVLIAWAMLSITAGLASILNATVPIFTALIAPSGCASGSAPRVRPVWPSVLPAFSCSLPTRPISSPAAAAGRSLPCCWRPCPMAWPPT
jgi:hypothetical protein